LNKALFLLGGLFIAACSGVEQAPGALEPAKVTLEEERLSDLSCRPSTVADKEFVEDCQSSVGGQLFIIQAVSGCIVSPGKLVSEWSAGKPVRQCMPDLIWRKDGGSPAALAYRISQYDDTPSDIERNYYRGSWIITTVGKPDQEVCATHIIREIGAREVVLRELRELTLPQDCDDNQTYIDVN
jgi:hypothetical protein